MESISKSDRFNLLKIKCFGFVEKKDPNMVEYLEGT